MNRMCSRLTRFIVYIFSIASLTGYSTDVLIAEEISIIAVGDITIGSGLTPVIEQHGVGVLFQETKDLIKSADIATASLNTSISDLGEPRFGVEHPFRAVPALARGLANAGFNVVSLATPHVLDFGVEALADTVNLLNWYHVEAVGAGETPTSARKPAWVHVNSAAVAFLAYRRVDQFATDTADPIAYAVHSEMVKAVAHVRQEADLIIVWLYWGKAGQTESVSGRQRFFARSLIDAGADMVLCQRLHTLQGTEIHNGKPIIYSLADFMYENYDKQHSKIVVPKVTFDIVRPPLASETSPDKVSPEPERTLSTSPEDVSPELEEAEPTSPDEVSPEPEEAELTSQIRLKSIELTPIWVDNPDKKYQPQILSGEAAQEALVHYQKLCAELETSMTIEGERGWIFAP